MRFVDLGERFHMSLWSLRSASIHALWIIQVKSSMEMEVSDIENIHARPPLCSSNGTNEVSSQESCAANLISCFSFVRKLHSTDRVDGSVMLIQKRRASAGALGAKLRSRRRADSSGTACSRRGSGRLLSIRAGTCEGSAMGLACFRYRQNSRT